MNIAMTRRTGFQCPVRGCDKKKNRRFSIMGLTMHLQVKHPGVIEKRLNLQIKDR